MHAYIHKSLENAAKVRIWPFCDRRNSTQSSLLISDERRLI